MDFIEFKAIVESHHRQLEARSKEFEEKVYIYASVVSGFVGRVLNGKDLPSISEVFPNDFQEKEDNSWLLIKERLIDFANERNRRNKNGN